jgi:tRNA(Ile2)-agmatinylcytidine synthase
MVALHVGFDDTDSLRGGCTTYIAALLVEKLQQLGATFNDYPNLVRLNPDVPWKTRGNGALCLRIACNKSMVDSIFEVIADTVEKNSDLSFKDTDPGIVFYYGAEIPREIKAFAKKTIQGIVKMEQALKLIEKFEAEALGFGTGYGIIGALAAIGETLDGDHTYEVIAYRTPENRGTRRLLDPESVKEMDQKTYPETFNNIDPETKRILITPRGPDPILYGVRGETAEAVIRAHKTIRPLEPVERWVVFRTNHGTDAHLRKINKLSSIKPYSPVIVKGIVASMPKLIPRRHRIFSIKDETGKVDCAAYEPTGTLRKIARQLLVGDYIEVYGGVRPSTSEYSLTVNLEKLRILKLAQRLIAFNPKCLECGRSTSSMGTGQGFRCSKCGFRSSTLRKVLVEEKRSIIEGLFVTSPRSQRHLTKPLSRYGKEKTCKPEGMLASWHFP